MISNLCKATLIKNSKCFRQLYRLHSKAFLSASSSELPTFWFRQFLRSLAKHTCWWVGLKRFGLHPWKSTFWMMINPYYKNGGLSLRFHSVATRFSSSRPDILVGKAEAAVARSTRQLRQSCLVGRKSGFVRKTVKNRLGIDVYVNDSWNTY